MHQPVRQGLPLSAHHLPFLHRIVAFLTFGTVSCLASTPISVSFPTNPRSKSECAKIHDTTGASIQNWWSKSTQEADRRFKLGSKEWSQEYSQIGVQGSKLYDSLSVESKACYLRVEKDRRQQLEKERKKAQQPTAFNATARPGLAGTNPSNTMAGSSIEQGVSVGNSNRGWQDREVARSKRENDLNRRSEEILNSVQDEDRRHEAMDKIIAELARINRERQTDRKSSEGMNSSGAINGEESNIALKASKRIVTKTLEIGVKTIEADIERAPKYLSGDNLNHYRVDARDTKSVLGGLNKMVTHVDYAILASEAAKAETSFQRDEAFGEMGFQFVADLTKKGFESEAVRSVVSRLIGQRSAAVLLGPAAWVATDVLTPEKIAYEDPDIIRDQSGRFTLAQQQEALAKMWRGYERYGYAWGDGQKIQLLSLSNAIYRRSNTQRRDANTTTIVAPMR